MNFSASGVKAVKSFLSLGALPLVARAKTKVCAVVARCWPSSKQGLEEMTWPTLEVPPPK